MKSVGIKALKDKLSAYLKLVREGETVLVTDRDEVIAEIRSPSLALNSGLSRFEQYLLQSTNNGSVRRATAGAVFPSGPQDLLSSLPLQVSANELLSETRGDRFEDKQ